MAIFTKDGAERGEPARNSVPGDASISIIAAGMKITGDLESTGVLKVEGEVEGSIRGARQVLLGRQGHIRGDVTAREIVLGGQVTGTITAAERLEIQSTASVTGDITTKALVVLEGGKINGNVTMSEQPLRSIDANRLSTSIAI